MGHVERFWRPHFSSTIILLYPPCLHIPISLNTSQIVWWIEQIGQSNCWDIFGSLFCTILSLCLPNLMSAIISHFKELPYPRHYNPRFVHFLPPFYIEVRFILQTTYVLKTEILHFFSLKSAVYTQERFLIKSGL